MKNLKQSFKEYSADLIQTWKLFLPRIFIIDSFYAASFLINPIAKNAGQITAFDIGTSIQGAFFIVITSLGTVFFPDLSKTLHQTDIPKASFWKMLKKYLLISAFSGIGVTVLAIVISPLVIHIYELIGKGQGNGQYIVQIAQITALSLFFRSIREILSKYFYVKERMWQPAILSTTGLVVQILSTLALYWMNFDVALACSIGLILYNVAWLALGYLYLKRDVYNAKVYSD